MERQTMIIHYNENPLKTRVELDDRDLEILKLNIKIARLEDVVFEISYYVKDGKHYDLERVRKVSKYELEEDANIERLYEYAVEELTLGRTHLGDCTKFPMSCEKCWAESLIGINTIEGMSGSGHYINNAFDDDRTIEEAIEWLENYAPVKTEQWLKNDPNGETWNEHFPRWKKGAQQGAEWLKKYRAEHFLEKRIGE
jgi:hypothetical protein